MNSSKGRDDGVIVVVVVVVVLVASALHFNISAGIDADAVVTPTPCCSAANKVLAVVAVVGLTFEDAFPISVELLLLAMPSITSPTAALEASSTPGVKP